MAITDIAKMLDETLKSLHLLQERHERYEKTFTDLRNENSELRKEVAGLTVRVAALEEGRKTVAAEVKVAVTESLTVWKLQEMQEKLKAAQNCFPLHRTSDASDGKSGNPTTMRPHDARTFARRQ